MISLSFFLAKAQHLIYNMYVDGGFMENLNELMFDKLSLIYNTIKLLENSSEEKLIDVSLLINNDYTSEDIMKMIAGLLSGETVTIEKKKIPSENLKLIEEVKKESVDGSLYTTDLENPYFSADILKYLLEYRLEGLPIETLINPNLTVEDLNKMLSYYIHTRISSIYNEILYMDKNSLAKLIESIDSGEKKVVEYLTEFSNTRAMMINKIKDYMDKHKKVSERVPGHNSYTKVYMRNRYNKNN